MNKEIMNREILYLCEKLVEKAKASNTVIATAESCTGGMVSSYITDVSGASEVFDRGFVTYSNEAKIQLLRVCKGVLEEHGAVSEQVAKQMCIGAVNNSNANLAVSITGVAGPTGGSVEKPVGLVYIGIYAQGWPEAKVTKCNFKGNRSEIREKTTKKAIELLFEAS